MLGTFLRASLAICILSASAFAQRNLSSGSPVTENFDALTTSTVNVTNNGGPIVGLYTLRQTGNADPNVFVASTGSATAGSFYNFGVAGVGPVTDRALGAITVAGVTENVFYGLRMVNSGTLPITSVSVGYTGEHWRDSNGSELISFSYRVSSTPITDLTSGTYTTVAALGYIPNNPPGNGAIDGNAPANRQVIAPFSILLSSPLLPGHELMIRWADVAVGGNNNGIAIDDVSVTVIGVTAGEVQISGRVTDAFGRAISGALITTTDSAGNSKLVLTNAFGYYTVTELETGQTYLLSVSARRHTFSNATRVIDLTDNVDNMDFVANR